MATRKARPVLFELVKRKSSPPGNAAGKTAPLEGPSVPPNDVPPSNSGWSTASPIGAPALPPSAARQSARPTAPMRASVPAHLGPPLNGRPASAAAVAAMNRLLRHVGGPRGVVIAGFVVFGLLALWQSLVYLRNQSAAPRDANASNEPAPPAPAVPALAGGASRTTPPGSEAPRLLPPRQPAPVADERLPAPAAPPEMGVKPAPPTPAPVAPAPAPPPNAPPVLEKGRHYVVVQHFRASERDAAHAALAYLQSHGVAVGLDESRREFRLIALEPFLLEQKDAAARQREQKRVDALKQQIRALGREYARTAGYAFDQCYERKF